MVNRDTNQNEIEEEKDVSDTTSEMDLEKGDASTNQDHHQQQPSMNPLKYQHKPSTLISNPTAREKQLKKERTLERTYSISGSISRARVPVKQRMAGEFRTLSINLTEGGLNERGTKKGGKVTKEISDLDWHKITPEETLSRLGSSLTQGLDEAQVSRRQKADGPNKMSKPPNRWAQKIFGYIFGGFGSLLLGASIVCFIAWKPLGNPNPQVSNLALACVLLAVVAFQALFNAYQDFSTSRVMESVGSMLPQEVLVVRNSTRVTIPSHQVVRGDIVVLSMGSKMAADMKILELEGDLKFDRSVLTGESDAINASIDMTDENYLETRNVIMAGTHCVSGSGLAIVTTTGDRTVFGRLAKVSSAPKSGKTTLQKEIFLFVVIISSLAATLVVICAIIWGTFLHPKHPDFMSVSTLLVNLVSIAVAFIPEGLPIAVTLSLTVIANKMRKVKVLARSLAVVETLGCVNVVCSDKTGTLTANKMFAQTLGIFGFSSTPQDAAKHITLKAPVGKALKQLQFVGAVCNAASFDEADSQLPLNQRRIHGDATDSAILRVAEEIHGLEQANQGWEKVYQLSFNSKNKFMLKLIKNTDSSKLEGSLSDSEISKFSSNDMILLSKGAPDILLERCTSILDASSNVLELTEERRAQFSALQRDWAAQGQRVLLLCRKVIPSNSTSFSLETITDNQAIELNTGLTAVGLIGIVDPPRVDTLPTVQTIRKAGARFFMVTGDFELTAVAIARQCGIITASKVHGFSELQSVNLPVYDVYADNDNKEKFALSLTGKDIMRMEVSDWEIATRFDEICFSRTSPDQKLRIVKEFQAREGVVAMTGDGVNDAPSLKQADVGVAMGSGSEVAMEASDLVLLGDFSSIVDALLLGRLCFANLQKTCLYLLPAGSFAELWAVLLSFFFGLPQALSNLQMIFICCLTDLIPSLALTQEKAEADLLKRKPRNVKKDHIISWRLLMHAYLFVGVPLTVCASSLAFWWMQRKEIPFGNMWLKYGGGFIQTSNPEYFNEILNQANAIYFFTLVLMQWANLLSIRTRTLSVFQQAPLGNPKTSNWMLFPAMASSLIIAVFLSYIPALQKVFLTRGVTVEYYFIPMALGVGMLLLDEARKYLARTYPKGFVAKISW